MIHSPERVQTASVLETVFPDGSEMSAVMRALDWASTPLGPVEGWPQSLRTAIGILLASRFPMAISWGPDFICLYNDAYVPLLGRKPVSIGRPAREIWPEAWSIVRPEFEGVIETGQSTWSENRLYLLNRQGYLEECYFTVSNSAIRDDRGQPAGVFSAATETTDQVLTERRLHTLRELAAQTAEAKTVEAVCTTAAQVLAGNQADVPFALLYLLDTTSKQARLAGTVGLEPGLPASPVVIDLDPGRSSPWPLARVFSRQHLEIVSNLVQRVGRLPGGPWPESPDTAMILPLLEPGQAQPVAVLIAGISLHRALDTDYWGFLEMAAGQIATATGLTRVRQQMTQQGHEHARRLQYLAEASLAINSTLSLKDTVQLITDQARKIIGAHLAIASLPRPNRAEAIHAVSLSDQYSSWQDYQPGPDNSALYALVCETNQTVRMTQTELEAHPVWHTLNAAATSHPPLQGWLAAPLIGRDGQNLGLIQLSNKEHGEFTPEDEAILTQLAQIASAAVENARLYQETQEAVEARNRLLSTVSHDLKNPLTTIRGYAQMCILRLARRVPADDARLNDGLERIDTTVSKMLRMIDELVDFGRLQSGQPLTLNRQSVNLVALARQVADEYQQTTTHHSIQVEASQPELFGYWDPIRLERVLGNLLSNAIKYSPDRGQVTVTVTREDAESGSWAILKVRDQGIGIPAADLPHIFEQFHRAANTVGQIKGTGIGLSSACRIVELHGGAIEVESELGQGSTFMVRLPIQ